MTWRHLHDEEAETAGDVEGDLADLHGVAPPCRECGEQERADGDLCGECAD